MNERIKKLAEYAGLLPKHIGPVVHTRYMKKKEQDFEKFAELLVRECMKESMDEIISDEDINAETDLSIREYLIGRNIGIVDAVIRFRNHFGVEE
jgi:hypothetical protein